MTFGTTLVYTPEQNKKIVQLWKARALFFTAVDFPKELWVSACNAAVYILNRTGPTPMEDTMPLELWAEVCNSWSLACFGDRMLRAHF